MTNWKVAMLALGLIVAVLVVPSVGTTDGSEPIGPEIMADPVVRINSDAELAVEADFGSGTVGDPWIICDREIIATGESYGIFIGNITEYWQINETAIMDVDGTPNWWWEAGHGIHVWNCVYGEIFNNTINNTNYGICVSNSSSEISVHDNDIWDCDNRGIAVIGTDDSDFSGNTISGNLTMSMGITFDLLSDNHTVESNIIDNTTLVGIGANDSWWMSITDNIITGNMTDMGVDGWYGQPYWGVYLYNSFHWDIQDCLITNTSIGIQLDGDTWGSYDGLVYSNDIEDCVQGIYTNLCDNISISYNYISTTGSYLTVAGAIYGTHHGSRHMDTTLHHNYIHDVRTGIYIEDYTTNSLTLHDNHLYDNAANAWCGPNDAYVLWWNPVTAKGNWWDDWTTPDSNGDGIVDTPYAIAGTGANYDSYPQCTASGIAMGGGGAAPAEVVDPITDTSAAEESGWDLNFGLLFWVGAFLLLVGLLKVPVPYLQSSSLMIIGAALMVINFMW